MQSRWKPALAPGWRPPSGSGWSIMEVPAGIAPDNVMKAWTFRTRRQNKNGAQAVNEMAEFLHANGVAIPKDVRSIIENHADVEWCGREPSRCHKKILLNAAKLNPALPTLVAHVAAQRVSQPVRVVAAKPCRSCGGGRVR